MPLENMEEEGLEKNPNLEYAQWRFRLGTDLCRNDSTIKNNLTKAIEKDSKYTGTVHPAKCKSCHLRIRIIVFVVYAHKL